jgi:hypothetical protein
MKEEASENTWNRGCSVLSMVCAILALTLTACAQEGRF